jgi:glycerol-3-phosphate dehydrogenase (NAD(P)+)
MPLRISIIGDGSMATVCALLLESRGHHVTLWGAFPDYVASLIQTRENRKYLPGYRFPQSVRLTADDRAALRDAELIVSAVPTQYMRPVWQRLAPHLPAGVPLVSVAKGIETETLLRPTQIIAEVLLQGSQEAGARGQGSGARRDTSNAKPETLNAKRHPLAALSGPSVADELARCLPATVCAASDDPALAALVQQTFTTHWFRVYTNPDLLGVELAGATKNVIALAAGILDGLHAGVNAKSALLSRGLAEIARLGVAMGAQQETFFGVAGVGDLATTCFSPTGRNRTCGELLGKGRKLDDVLKQIPGVVEGVPTTKAVVALAKKYGVEMPITAAVHQVLFEGLDPIEGISQLMRRELKGERVG